MSRRKDSWFKWVVNRWFAGTRSLSYEEKGLYADLITAWRDGQTVPNDPVQIAKDFGVRDYRTVRRPLAGLLKKGKVKVDQDGNLYREDVDDEIAERLEQRRAKSGGGGGGQEGGGQQGLPFRPYVVHDAGDNHGETSGRIPETPERSAAVAPMIADCPPSPARKPLIGNESRSATQSPEWTDSQTVVAAAPEIPPRARGSPTVRA